MSQQVSEREETSQQTNDNKTNGTYPTKTLPGTPTAKSIDPSVQKVEQSESSNNTPGTNSTDAEKQTKDAKKEATVLPTNTKGLHTVFIHKLYNMLEDEELKHLIWWSPSNESFLLTPGEEFSKALSQYFKHTNVASFIRQLNMYGFHKVSDGSSSSANASSDANPEAPVWEFRHSSGNFKKGDINSLKSIKRRSSKHTSKSISSFSQSLEPSNLSDTEGSERSNSFSDLAGLNDNMANNNINPVLNVRLTELGHSLAALRHEHARLQLRYDTAIDDLRKTNMDMVYLLDLVQKLIRSQHEAPKPEVLTPVSNAQHKPEDGLASPGSVPDPASHYQPVPHHPSQQQPSSQQQQPQQQLQQPIGPNPYHLQDVESDIAKFRASIIQRAAAKDFDQYSVSFAPSYQMNPTSRGSTSAPQVFQPSRTSSQVNVPTEEAPVPYPYPFPPNHHPQQQAIAQPYVLQPQQQIVRDPFQSDRKSSSSSSKRHMSILYDPLQPTPGPNQVGSPAASSIHRASVSASNPDTAVTSPAVNNSGSYFPEYQPARVRTPDQQQQQPQPPFRPGPMSREQRPGSFPTFIPGVKNSLKGSNDALFRKRHSSNDATDFQRQMSENNNPPRSIPTTGRETTPQYHPQPTHINPINSPHVIDRRQSISPGAADVNFTKNQNLLNNNSSGVYALLNPERRDSTAAEAGVPSPKKVKR